jgi:2-C-methyl-D-erythritol 4-phosphate cytidylyltransferase
MNKEKIYKSQSTEVFSIPYPRKRKKGAGEDLEGASDLTVIIVAGGKGERMQTDVPKQLLNIRTKTHGWKKPVLMHTMRAFYNYDHRISIIVVLPMEQIDYWRELCKKHKFHIEHQIIGGGATRFHSVRNGLSWADADSLIAVHDGVRPLVSRETIARCFENAKKYKAVVPVVDLVDSVRYADENENRACDRTKYKLVQTPQVFDGKLLKKAYEQEFSPAFTDDASVVEAVGVKIHLVAGNRENIKITTAVDLKLIEVL